MEIPSPLAATTEQIARLAGILENMSRREVTHLISDSLQNCHTIDHLREVGYARMLE